MTLAVKKVMLVMIYGLAQVAQLVEQRIENPRVGGSNPPLGTTLSPPEDCVTPAMLAASVQLHPR